jgi:Tol biopolymer transport system component/tRNA A-37 threonylcarbamoyl transferase component Bud32
MAPLAVGTKLGAYEIVGAIGAGGMGTVYRARDTRLPRDAAIKISAEKFTERFAREAHAIASLNHPNITTLYDIGPDYLVMELVEGPTLADRLKQGPLSLDEASTIARQIADALDYAHEHGIVHRDLKPGNVKIRPDGVVKVLDFGLAKAGGARVAGPSNDSPTLAPQTAVGMIVGTAAYMAPEQVKGQELDKRADIWAFGCVFYEMLTGGVAYHGDTSQETMASILRDQPDLEKVPARARRLLRRCLEKDPQQRLRHIGDVMALLDEPPSGGHVFPASSTRRRWLTPALAAALVLVAGAGVAVWAPWRSRPTAVQPVRFEIGETEAMKFFYGSAMAVSPDGHWLAFPATGADGVNRYWLRSLDSVEARALPGTEDAYTPVGWSADSRYVIFTVRSRNQLSKVDIHGGPPQAVAEVPDGPQLNGATTNAQGVVVFGQFSIPGFPLFRAPLSGGPAVPVTALNPGDARHIYPHFLPDGRHFLYLRVSADPRVTGIYIGDIQAAPTAQSPTRLLATNRQAYYAKAMGDGTGHLLFLRDTTLLAQPFDPTRLAFTGEPTPVAERVDSFSAANFGLFSVSENGTLSYRGGPGSALVPTWFNPRGLPVDKVAEPGEYGFGVALSPEGTRLAVVRGPTNAGWGDLWVLDLQRGKTQRLVSGPADSPVWSPDGTYIAYTSRRSGSPQLYLTPADGSGEERLLTNGAGTPTSWSRDGFLFFYRFSPKTGFDLWALRDPGKADATAFPVLATPLGETNPHVSPDGRWLAYQAFDSRGTSSIFVRPFAPNAPTGASEAKWLVSQGPLAYFPRWRADGRQLFYTSLDTFGVFAVDLDLSHGFRASVPRRLFTAPGPLLPVGWDVAPDGQRFLFLTSPDGGRMPPFTVVLNWQRALEAGEKQ